MTSQVISPMSSVGLRFPDATAPAVVGHGNDQVGATASWRRKGTVKAFVGLCWVLGTCAAFLTVGVVGMFAADVPWYQLKTLEDVVEDINVVETTMAELAAGSAPAEEATEEPVELPTEITEMVETPPEVQDLPELVEAMTTEDIFAIPTAPRIEDALRPVDPVAKPRLRPSPTPAKPRSTVARSGGTGVPNARPGIGSGIVGGTGTGKGTSKGRYPKPTYPSAARSAGMQGTVRLKVRFGVTGAVESVSVISSSGYSALDGPAEAYVRRYWNDQGRASQTITVPVTFKLN